MLRFSSAMLATLGLTFGLHSLSMAQTAAPAGETTWDLRKSIDHAIQNNLQVRQVGLQVEQSAIDVSQAGTNRWPTINASGSHGLNNGYFENPVENRIVNSKVWSGNFSLQSSVNLYSGFQAQNTVKRNKIDYQATLLDQERAKNDIVLNVVAAYMTILLNQELLKTNQERLSLTQSQLERTNKLFKAGSVPESNVLDLNAQIASDELNIITAQNQIDLAELRLIQLLNLESANPENFSIVIPEVPNPDQSVINFDVDDVYATAETGMPQIKAALLRIESAKKSIDIAKGAYHPTLSLVGNLSSAYSRTVISDQVIIADPYFTQLADHFRQFAGVSLQVPILNGFRTRNNVQLSRINLRNSELSSEITKNELKQSIAQAYTDAIGAQRRYASAKKQLEAFEQAFRNAEIRLENGLINNVDFNVARNNLVKAQSDIIQAKYDFVFKFKILEFYQGKTITL